jgi:Pseudomonas avirulence D protein (AvrD)
MGAKLSYPSIEDYLGPADGRFFSRGFRRSEHEVSGLLLTPGPEPAAGAKAVATVRYPPDWSTKAVGTDLRPHLSTVDALILSAQLAEAHLAFAYGLDGRARAAMWLRRVTVRAGAAPQEDLIDLPCSAELRRTTSAQEGDALLSVYDCSVGVMRVTCEIEHSAHAAHAATGTANRGVAHGEGGGARSHATLEDALGPAHERYYGAGYKFRQHGVEDVRIDMGELRSAGTARIEPAESFPDLTAGIEGQYQPSLSMIDCFVVNLQLAQVLMYEMDSIARQDTNTLWMIKTRLDAERPQRPFGDSVPAQAQITARPLVPLRGGIWRNVDISAQCGGVTLRSSFAHELPGQPASVN